MHTILNKFEVCRSLSKFHHQVVNRHGTNQHARLNARSFLHVSAFYIGYDTRTVFLFHGGHNNFRAQFHPCSSINTCYSYRPTLGSEIISVYSIKLHWTTTEIILLISCVVRSSIIKSLIDMKIHLFLMECPVLSVVLVGFKSSYFHNEYIMLCLTTSLYSLAEKWHGLYLTN